MLEHFLDSDAQNIESRLRSLVEAADHPCGSVFHFLRFRPRLLDILVEFLSKNSEAAVNFFSNNATTDFMQIVHAETKSGKFATFVQENMHKCEKVMRIAMVMPPRAMGLHACILSKIIRGLVIKDDSKLETCLHDILEHHARASNLGRVILAAFRLAFPRLTFEDIIGVVRERSTLPPSCVSTALGLAVVANSPISKAEIRRILASGTHEEIRGLVDDIGSDEDLATMVREATSQQRDRIAQASIKAAERLWLTNPNAAKLLVEDCRNPLLVLGACKDESIVIKEFCRRSGPISPSVLLWASNATEWVTSDNLEIVTIVRVLLEIQERYFRPKSV